MRFLGALVVCTGYVAIALLASLAGPAARADLPFSPNIRVNPDIAPAQATNPSLVVGPDGTVYATWQDDRNGDWDIWFSKSSDGGLTWTEPSVRVDGDSTGSWAGVPLIARSPTGTLYVAWQDDRNGDRDIYFARSTDGGATWSGDVRVNTDATSTTHHQQAIAVHSSDVYLAWADARNGSFEVYFAASADGGATWTDPNLRIGVAASTPGNASSPFLAVDPSGTLYASWADDRTGDYDIWFARSLDGGATWTDGSQRVNTDAGPASQHRVALATGPGNAVYAVWQDNRSDDYDVYFAASMDRGDTWTHPNVRVDADPGTAWQESPEIVVDPTTGHLYVTWHDLRNGDRDIYLAHSADAGTTWFNTNTRVNDDLTSTIQWFPRIAFDPSSWRVYAVWSDGRRGATDVFLAYLQANRPPEIAATPGPPTSATVGVPLTLTLSATDPDGDPLTWSKVSGPAWLDVGPANGTLHGAPTQGDVGTNSFVVEVSDEEGASDRVEFSIVVESPPASEGLPVWALGALVAGIALIAAIAFVALRRRKRGAPP